MATAPSETNNLNSSQWPSATTNVFVEVDLEHKAQMLEKTNALRSNPVSKRPWKENPSLMAFIRSI